METALNSQNVKSDDLIGEGEINDESLVPKIKSKKTFFNATADNIPDKINRYGLNKEKKVQS